VFYCTSHHLHKLWHAFIGHRHGRLLCLAPEEFEKSRCGPCPKKVVHHWGISCIHVNIYVCLLLSFLLSVWLSCFLSVDCLAQPRDCRWREMLFGVSRICHGVKALRLTLRRSVAETSVVCWCWARVVLPEHLCSTSSRILITCTHDLWHKTTSIILVFNFRQKHRAKKVKMPIVQVSGCKAVCFKSYYEGLRTVRLLCSTVEVQN